jgi:nucleoside 2-deoxyribosyltransferase
MGEQCPEIAAEVIEDVRRERPLTVHERADRLLKKVSSELSDIADVFENRQDESLMEVQRRMAHSESLRIQEINYLISFLECRHWIEGDGSKQHPIARYRITVDAYARLAELDRAATDLSKAFVAMWFHDSMQECYENAIKPGIEEAGYEAVRIDRKEHLNKIDDEIIAELRRARFVVADFTHDDDGPRGGVYYEAGFAHGRGIDVVFCCRTDLIEQAHFDTRQYPHILWEAEKLDEFRDRLATRISAVIGDGPRKK